ncbi:MAG: PilZ domain-containing protein, partial [Proteobacteria bacterium]|nr:PilZ domain-containing protein [Pseudomonadota bacterium]
QPGGDMSDDRRDFPRIETEHSVELVDGDGSAFPTLALDISLTGMQLLCDQPTAERIAPGGETKNGDGSPRELVARLRVKCRDGNRERIGVHCSVMSVRKVEPDEFRIGVKFTGFEGDSYHALEAWIDDTLPD